MPLFRTALAAASLMALLARPAVAADPVRFSVNWLPEGEHCGFYQALGAGYYAKAGLDVTIKGGGPDVNVGLLVANGQIDLAMGSSFTSLNMVADGIPGETVAAFLQKDPQTIVAHEEDGIRTLSDLKGKPIMIGKFSQQEFWQFLKVKFGFDDRQLRPYTYSAAPYLADLHSAQQGYVTEDGFLLTSQMVKPPVILLLADYGYQNYASTVFGMKPWIDAHKDVVRRFIEASAQGYKDCTTGEAPEGMALVLKANPEHGEPLWHYKLKQMRERGMAAGGDAAAGGIGVMTDARWKDFFDTMSSAGLYPKTVKYQNAYTTEFTKNLPKL